jgi:hypothetical protein
MKWPNILFPKWPSRFRDLGRQKPWERPGRTFIVPTFTGIAFGLFLFLFLLIAYFYENNLIYLYVFWLTAFGHGVLWVSNFLLDRLSPHFKTSAYTFCSERTPFQFCYNPPKMSFQVGVNFPFSAPLDLTLAPQTKEVQGFFTPNLRKYFLNPKAKIQTTAPIDFLRTWRFIEMAPLAILAAPKDHLSALNPHTPNSDPSDFERLKEWTPSSGPRKIFWGAYAKNRSLIEKVSRSQQQDLQKEFHWQDLAELASTEQRLEQVSFWIKPLLNREAPFVFHLPQKTYQFPQDKNELLKDLCEGRKELWNF